VVATVDTAGSVQVPRRSVPIEVVCRRDRYLEARMTFAAATARLSISTTRSGSPSHEWYPECRLRKATSARNGYRGGERQGLRALTKLLQSFAVD
jgi:hypothetical protein